MRRRFVILAALAAFPALALGQAANPLKHTPQPTKPPVTAADLMTRLYILADDSMAGRQGGTEGNLKATAYIAAEAKRLGLVPAGDSGTYFQYVPLVRRTFKPADTLSVDSLPLVSPRDFLPITTRGTPRSLDGVRVIYGGIWTDSSTWISAEQAAGRLVVFGMAPAAPGQPGGLPFLRSNSRFVGAAGIALPVLERVTPRALNLFTRPAIGFSAAATRPSAEFPRSLIISMHAAAVLLGRRLDSVTAGDTGRVVRGAIVMNETPAPGRNVVAILPGSDKQLRGEYVAIGAHSDHIGTRDVALDHDSLRAALTAAWELRHRDIDAPAPSAEAISSIHVNVDSLHKVRPARRDSINNGADDDGSGSVAVLEIAQAMAAMKPHPKRSILFVWHTGEELGLLGSRWYTDHTTVPRDSIVAQLNIDMIGRGGAADIKNGSPLYLQLIGSSRLSTELGQIVESTNKARKKPFVLDYTFDANGHPENIYCRSDHANYARYSIPITFFTTGTHQDYHQLTDEPQYIDYPHFAQLTQFIMDVGVTVANLDHRVVVDHPKPDPEAGCRQ
jgi:hypothetical protein